MSTRYNTLHTRSTERSASTWITSNMADFTTLESLTRMLSPVDFVGSLQNNLGSSYKTSNEDASIIKKILELLVNSSSLGITSSKNLISRLNDLLTSASPELQKQFYDYFTIYCSSGIISGEPDFIKTAKVNGEKISNVPIDMIIGADFRFSVGTESTIFLSKSPFVQPTNRNVSLIETFLNNIPSVIASSMKPYLDIEFISDRPGLSTALKSMSLIKFLGGAADISESDSTPTGVLVNSRRRRSRNSAGIVVDTNYSGMELFTSPQTLVNTNDLDGTLRYQETIDKFKPFGTIKSFDINVNPTVGFFTYKTGKLTLQIHDRSRLNEISDFIKPEVYTQTTLWITYGWRCPVDDNNAYFSFINEKMITREAYGIKNCSLDLQGGGVNIVLELFTKGVSELNTIKINDSDKNMKSVMSEIEGLVATIKEQRIALKLQSPENATKEIRFFKLLDAAEAGEFPDLSDPDILKSIDEVRSTLRSTIVNESLVQKVSTLLDNVSKLYTTTGDGKNKTYAYKDRIKTLATNQIAKKYEELLTGADPFEPDDKKDPGNPLIPLINAYNSEKSNENIKDFKKGTCSFGKLFATFVMRGIFDNIKSIDDLQVMFYSLNSSCGPASGTNIASFPIELPVFMDRYRQYISSRGGERITIKEFVSLVIETHFLDDRSIAYGHRQFFQPYNPKDPDAKVIDKLSKGYESSLAAQTAKYGPFQRPVIELFVETLNEKPEQESLRVDTLTTLSVSASNAQAIEESFSKKVMRIHIYDKSNNPHRIAGAMLKGEGNSYYELPSTDYVKSKFSGDATALATLTNNAATKLLIDFDASTGKIKYSNVGSLSDIKKIISSLVPTILYGSVGSTISAASVVSQHDELLSTVQMIKSSSKMSSAQPNGSDLGNLPLLIIPVEATITTLGCPLITPQQMFFIDFNTGTTIDNMYVVTGLQHIISDGKFDTILKLSFYDAYGKYRTAQDVLTYLKKELTLCI